MLGHILTAAAIVTLLLEVGRAQIFDVDAGVQEQDAHYVSGRWSSTYSVEATRNILEAYDETESRYRSHRFGVFDLSFPLVSEGKYKVALGFAEVYLPACQSGARVFNVLHNDLNEFGAMDVYEEAGCNTALVKTMEHDTNVLGATLILQFRSTGVENPMISSVTVELVDSLGTTMPPTSTPVTSRPFPTTTSSSIPLATTTSPQEQTGLSTERTVFSSTASSESTTPGSTASTTTGNTVSLRITTTEVPNISLSSITSSQTSMQSSLPVSSFLTSTTSPTTQSTRTSSSSSTTSSQQSSFSTSLPGPDGEFVFDIDAGSEEDENEAFILGWSMKWSAPYGIVDIVNTDETNRYNTHRFGAMKFLLPLEEAGDYRVTLGFAEMYEPNCEVGRRVFSVLLGGSFMLEAFDVYAESGACFTAIERTFEYQAVSVLSTLVLEFSSLGGVENPMVSSIRIQQVSSIGDSSTTVPVTSLGSSTATTSSISSSVLDSVSDVSVDCGSINSDLDTMVFGNSSKVQIPSSPSPSERGSSYRTGLEFSYNISIVPGTYDISFGFYEDPSEECGVGNRVFNIIVNSVSNEILTSIDVAKETLTCENAVEKTVRRSIDVEHLSIQFASVAGVAAISWIDIRAVRGCELIVGTTDGVNHRAHAVPGEYPPQIDSSSPKSYIDFDGDGYQRVLIDGFKSHTHFQDFSDPANPALGSIVSYKWTNMDTSAVISEEASFEADFPMGTTRLLLQVRDSSCDEAEAETTVTVTSVVSPGAYCYYYDTSERLVGPEMDGTDARPTFAYERVSNFVGILSQPEGFSSASYSVLCQFYYQVDSSSESTVISVDTGGSGDARIYKGGSLVLDSTDHDEATITLAVGLPSFEVILHYTSSGVQPSLTVAMNSSSLSLDKLSYDRSTVLPVLTRAFPSESAVEGGSQIIVSGYGFFSPPVVYFGGVGPIDSSMDNLAPNMFSVTTPAMPESIVDLSARGSGSNLASNALKIQFGDVDPPVAFTRKMALQEESSSIVNAKSERATCIAIWGDTWYLGTLGGKVAKMNVNENHMVISKCVSAPFVDPDFLKPGTSDPASNDILGITFDPSDTIGMPYVSLQVLYWFYDARVESSNMNAWQNGKIDRLRDDSSQCMVFHERVVSGLPISDHDHGVNGMTFDQNGDLLACVGGVTNGGVSHSNFGFMWESPLSASIVRIRLSLGADFNGEIEYDQDYSNHKEAQQSAGDVETFATGLRNSFDMCFTSKQRIYATDNGPNKGYGNYATACSHNDTTDGQEGDFGRQDKILRVVEGGYYGHPNLNREECLYIDPLTDLAVGAATGPPDPYLNYVDEVAMVGSSVNGIMEYTASHFGSALKGDLLATSFATGVPDRRGAVYRVREDGTTQTLDADWGGLSVAQSEWGDIIMPRVFDNSIVILEPDYPAPSTLSARVVTPFRGGAPGGLLVTITGHGFGDADEGDVTVLFGTSPCTLLPGSLEKTLRGSKLRCTTPSKSNTDDLVDVAVSVGSQTSTIIGGFLYTAG